MTGAKFIPHRIERGSLEWIQLVEKYHQQALGSCASCGAPFAKGCSCPHCTDQSPHVSQADKIKHGYPLEYVLK